ncbi:MAG: hypothetical protein AB7R40_25460 [Nitrospiraceae bacterium]
MTDVTDMRPRADAKSLSRIFELAGDVFSARMNQRLSDLEKSGIRISWKRVLELSAVLEIHPHPGGGLAVGFLVDDLEDPRTWIRWEGVGQGDAGVWDLQLAVAKYAKRYADPPTYMVLDLSAMTGALYARRGAVAIEIQTFSGVRK